MKAISLLQPWASLWAVGVKNYETRSWPTKYRGPVAIHASARKDNCGHDLWRFLWASHEGAMALSGIPRCFALLPFGKVIATTEFTCCVPTGPTTDLYINDLEMALGDYSGGRYVWVRGPVKVLPEPIPAKGMLGLWHFDDTLLTPIGNRQSAIANPP